MKEEVKLAALRYLRNCGLKRGEVSEITGIGYPTLTQWNNSYDERYVKLTERDGRGRHDGVSEEFINLINNSAQEYLKSRRGEKISRLKGFLKWFKKERKDELKNHPVGKSRRILTEILIANDWYEEKKSALDYPTYKPRIKRYYPNAQVVFDGSEINITFGKNSYDFNLELFKDMKSKALTSFVISDEETAEAVCEGIEEHRQKHGPPLAFLYDNSKANLAAEVGNMLEIHGIGSIKAYPFSPETKADIEGEFGKLKEVIYPLKISGETEKDLAKSMAATIVRLYMEMKNRPPQCGNCPWAPGALMNYTPTEEEKIKAAESLATQRERSEAMRKKREPAVPSEKEQLITGIIERNRLEVSDLDKFLKSLSLYDKRALEEAEESFYVYSGRDSFQETKRTGQYFCGIVRNKQMDIDSLRKKEMLRKKYFIDEEWKKRKEEERLIKEKREEEQRIKKYPEKEVSNGLIEGQKSLNVLGRVPVFFKDQIRKGLKIILSKQNWKTYLGRLKKEIMSAAEIDTEKRLGLAKKAHDMVMTARANGVNSVTLF